MKLSPLFWPIRFKGNIIYILDETALPQKLRYLKAKNYQEACLAIKQMKTRSVGQVILVMYIFLQALRQGKDIKKVALAINSSRLTLPFRFLTQMVLGWQKNNQPLPEKIPRFLKALKNARIKQAQEASRLIKDKDSILTYCNISGLMPLIAQFCQQQKRRVSFFVSETRPYLQGARLTAWELKRAGFKPTLICDSMAAFVLSSGKISKVIVGADHLARNGDIANKVGTYQLAVLAKHFAVPFYVLCPPASLAKSGKEIKIEIRPEKELLEYQGLRLAPEGARAYYPAFDITPAKLITKHIPLKVWR